jgi:hypothetical protein
MAFLPKIFPRDTKQQPPLDEQSLIRIEAEIGGKLFGPVPKGHERRFFCLDEHTWIWHEEWVEKGKRHVITTRYEVRPNGVLKLQDGHSARMISKAEAINLYRAVELYQQQVDAAYARMKQQHTE